MRMLLWAAPGRSNSCSGPSRTGGSGSSGAAAAPAARASHGSKALDAAASALRGVTSPTITKWP